MSFGFFECKFCNKRYIKEPQFLKHTCEPSARYTFITTEPRGKAAYIIYKKWIKARGFRTVTREIFIDSRYYAPIVRFAEFYAEAMLPDMDDYIKFVTKDKLLPGLWYHDFVYEDYVASFDERVSPLRQAEITYKNLDTLARQSGCTIAGIFDHIYVSDLVKLIQCRRLSPWVLMVSDRFYEYVNECTPEEKPALESMVNEDIWIPRFKANLKSYKMIVSLTKEFGI